jgi:hypothetical protein
MAKIPTDPRQLSFEDCYVIPQPPAPVPGSMDYDTELRNVLSLAIKESPFSRHEIAARMSDLTGADISVHMLNSWTAESHENHRFPFAFAAAFEVAAESKSLQLLLARKRGSLVLMGQEAMDAELGLIRRNMAELRRRETALMKKVGR